MSKFMKGIKGEQKDLKKEVIKAADIDAIADKLHAPIVPAVIETVPDELPSKKGRRKLLEEEKEIVHRLTIDIPEDMFEQMRKDTKRRGQTIKGFIVSLIYDHYEK
jgi:hypothetical protein